MSLRRQNLELVVRLKREKYDSIPSRLIFVYPNLKIAICIMTSSPIWYFYSSRNRYSLVQPPLPLQARWTSIWIIMFTGGRQEEGCLTIDRTETIGRTRSNKITSFLIRYLDHESLIGKIWTVSRLSIVTVLHCSRKFRKISIRRILQF